MSGRNVPHVHSLGQNLFTLVAPRPCRAGAIIFQQQKGERTITRKRTEEIRKLRGVELEQPGNLHPRDSRNTTGEAFHLVGEFIIDTPRCFVHRRAH